MEGQRHVKGGKGSGREREWEREEREGVGVGTGEGDREREGVGVGTGEGDRDRDRLSLVEGIHWDLISRRSFPRRPSKTRHDENELWNDDKSPI